MKQFFRSGTCNRGRSRDCWAFDSVGMGAWLLRTIFVLSDVIFRMGPFAHQATALVEDKVQTPLTLILERFGNADRITRAVVQFGAIGCNHLGCSILSKAFLLWYHKFGDSPSLMLVRQYVDTYNSLRNVSDNRDICQRLVQSIFTSPNASFRWFRISKCNY